MHCKACDASLQKMFDPLEELCVECLLEAWKCCGLTRMKFEERVDSILELSGFSVGED